MGLELEEELEKTEKSSALRIDELRKSAVERKLRAMFHSLCLYVEHTTNIVNVKKEVVPSKMQMMVVNSPCAHLHPPSFYPFSLSSPPAPPPPHLGRLQCDHRPSAQSALNPLNNRGRSVVRLPAQGAGHRPTTKLIHNKGTHTGSFPSRGRRWGGCGRCKWVASGVCLPSPPYMIIIFIYSFDWWGNTAQGKWMEVGGKGNFEGWWRRRGFRQLIINCIWKNMERMDELGRRRPGCCCQIWDEE